MKRISPRLSGGLALVVLFGLLGSACEKKVADSAAAAQPPSPTKVEIEVGAEGYQPSSVQATQGSPLTLVFRRTTDEGCGQKVKIPAHNIERDLPLNQPVEVTFTPNAAGQLAFTCGMNMMRGSIVVQ